MLIFRDFAQTPRHAVVPRTHVLTFGQINKMKVVDESPLASAPLLYLLRRESH